MKSLLFWSCILASLTAFAEIPILNCENQDPQNLKSIAIWEYDGVSLESYGQVSLAPFHSVNLVCNNASVLKSLGKDIVCAGVDRASPVSSPSVVSETIVATTTGYTWRGSSCW